MTGPPGEWLTVPQAAALIGVSERTLYRLLKSGDNAARTLTEHRQTATGRRQVTLVPKGLADELRSLHSPPTPETGADGGTGSAGENTDKNTDNGAARTPTGGDRTPANADTDTVAGPAEAPAGTAPVGVYRHRIADLEAQNAELRADKERLYRLLEMAQENLKREQSLRLLTVERAGPLEATGQGDSTSQEGTQEAQGEAETAPTADPGAMAGTGVTQGAAESKRRGWWQRLWNRA